MRTAAVSQRAQKGLRTIGQSSSAQTNVDLHRKGELIPIELPSGEVQYVTAHSAGHATLSKNANILDANGKKIAPQKMRVRRKHSMVPVETRVIDPGPQFKVAIEVAEGTLPHHSIVEKIY